MFSLRKKAPLPPPPPAPDRIPADRVMQLSQQGYSDPEIIRTLREEGYKPAEVDKALKQALKASAFGAPQQRASPGRPSLSDELDEGPTRSDLALPELPWQQKQQRALPPPPPRFDEVTPPAGAQRPGGWAPPRDDPAPPRRPLPSALPRKLDDDDDLDAPGPRQWPAPAPARRPADDDLDLDLPSLPGRRPPTPGAKRDSVSEVVEAVIEEKWDAIQGELEALEHRIKALEERSTATVPVESADLADRLHSSSQETAELSAKMDAMERVVKDSLTPMMETMRSLNEALRELKKSRE